MSPHGGSSLDASVEVSSVSSFMHKAVKKAEKKKIPKPCTHYRSGWCSGLG